MVWIHDQRVDYSGYKRIKYQRTYIFLELHEFYWIRCKG